MAVNPHPLPHFAPCTVAFGERFNSVRWHDPSRPADDYLLPGIIDSQVNGAYGISVMRANAAELIELAHCLAHDGTTAWMPTAITAPLDQIEKTDALIQEARVIQTQEENAAMAATILGMHLEGPFISPLRRGAHPALNLTPTGEPLERILRLRSLRMITLAPELEGALAAIPRFIEHGVTVALGHSDATYEQTLAAVAAGASVITHTFNAMRPLHHREPGLIGAALTHRQLYPAVIADGVHVHTAVLGIVCRSPNAMLVSDRVSPAGSTAAGRTQLLGGLIGDALVTDDAVRLSDGKLAGATASILDGIRLLVRHGVVDLPAMARLSSGAAAEMLGLHDRGRIAGRARADLIMLDRDLGLKAVFVGGRELDELPAKRSRNVP